MIEVQTQIHYNPTFFKICLRWNDSLHRKGIGDHLRKGRLFSAKRELQQLEHLGKGWQHSRQSMFQPHLSWNWSKKNAGVGSNLSCSDGMPLHLWHFEFVMHHQHQFQEAQCAPGFWTGRKIEVRDKVRGRLHIVLPVLFALYIYIIYINTYINLPAALPLTYPSQKQGLVKGLLY